VYVDDRDKILKVVDKHEITNLAINLPMDGRINYHAQNTLQKSMLAGRASFEENGRRNQSSSRRRIFGLVPHLSE